MERTPTPRSLNAVQRLLAQRGRPCADCGRPVDEEPPNVRMHGEWFHASCAVYRPRQRRRDLAA